MTKKQITIQTCDECFYIDDVKVPSIPFGCFYIELEGFDTSSGIHPDCPLDDAKDHGLKRVVSWIIKKIG